MQYEYDDSNDPVWLVNGKVDEVIFASELKTLHQMIYADGAFFTTEGKLRDENVLKQEIYQSLKNYTSSNVMRKVDNILAVLRYECGQKSLPLNERVLHLENGTYDLIDGLSQERQICRHRLPVKYLPNGPEPVRWLEFLNDLLEPEDIETLQEFMGYCLIPVNLGQKMLIIIGRGGEGKSRIGYVMKQMLGEGMNFGSIAKVETDRFARADLEHKLLMVDDDLRMEALPSTHNLKTMITAEHMVDLERKGVQSYQGRMYARFMAFGNGALQAANDASYGFFRRQIILQTKPRDPNRVDDPYLTRRLKQEIDGIFFWALMGLYRLLGQNFRFTLSQNAQTNQLVAMDEKNHIPEFLERSGNVVFCPDGHVTSKQLYESYYSWCQDNLKRAMSSTAFFNQLRLDAAKWALRYSNSVPYRDGKRVRGYFGMALVGKNGGSGQ